MIPKFDLWSLQIYIYIYMCMHINVYAHKCVQMYIACTKIIRKWKAKP